MTVTTTVTASGGADMFAALFEESLKSNDMRVGEVISAEVVRIEFNHVVVIAVPLVFSLLRYATFKEQGVPVGVVLVQPDIDPYTEKFGAVDPLAQLERMLAQAAPLVDSTTALVVRADDTPVKVLAPGFYARQDIRTPTTRSPWPATPARPTNA